MKAPFRVAEETVWDTYYNIAEYLGKLGNGWLVKDEYLIRYSARVVAQHSEKTVVALNDLSPVSENQVWHQVLAAKKKPAHFNRDYPVALGIKGTKQTRGVYIAGLRLGLETLKLIGEEFGEKTRRRAFRRLIEETPWVHLSGRKSPVRVLKG